MDDVPTDFSNLIIEHEGKIKFYTFDSSQFSDTGKAIKKSMPVFYNPIQELNRSVSQIVYKTFQKLVQENEKFQPFSFVDSMAASGIRSLRLLDFLNKPVKIYANDLNPLALEVIRKNLELNGYSETDLELSQSDALYFFDQLYHNRTRPSCIDIDPFGTPNIFIEPALRAVNLGGLVGITATDTAVLFGIKPTACQRKYNLRCLRSTFLKEVGLRLLLYYTAVRAHPYMNYIEPIISLSFDHYIRIFVRIWRGKTGITKNLENSGYILWCPHCDHCHTEGMNLREISFVCPVCGKNLDYGGPLWIGPLHDKEFIQKSIQTLNTTNNEEIPSLKRIVKIFYSIRDEDSTISGYYDIHKICDSLQASVPKTEVVLNEIRNLGYTCCLTHIDAHSIKSLIPIELLKKILWNLYEKSPNFVAKNKII